MPNHTTWLGYVIGTIRKEPIIVFNARPFENAIMGQSIVRSIVQGSPYNMEQHTLPQSVDSMAGSVSDLRAFSLAGLLLE